MTLKSKALLTFLLLAMICPGSWAADQAAKPSLYKRLGETAGISTVVGNFVDRVAKDERINGFFQNVDLDHLKKMLTDQICQATGGPCKYTGKDMKTVHQGMNIRDVEFDALVEDLSASMDELKVGKPEQDEVLAFLSPMRKDIVGQAAPQETPIVQATPATKPTKSLYERLGKQDAISAVVGELVDQIGQDDRIKKYFEGVDLDHLKKMLTDQICQAAGGPCKYAGKDMKTAHQGLGVTGEAFDALVDDLVKALTKFKVAAAEQKDLLALLGPMKGDIVEKKESQAGDNGAPAPGAPAPGAAAPAASASTGDELTLEDTGAPSATPTAEAAPAETPTPAPAAKKPAKKKGPTLYDRLGGKDAIHKVVNELIYFIGLDKRISKYFEGVDLYQLKLKLIDQVCQATGGPCEYKGKDMKTAHQGLGVTDAAFDALVDDLGKAMNYAKVPKKLQKEVVSLLAPMRQDIVEKKDGAGNE